MDDVLVDTSVWVDFFRNSEGVAGDLVDELIAEDRILLCGIVEMEIFQGIREKELSYVQSLFEPIRYVETTRDDFICAGKRWDGLRKKGVTIPPTDSLIAEICIRRNLPLLSLDVHFDYFQELMRVEL